MGVIGQVLEFLDNVVDETAIKVLATEVNSGLDLEDTFLDSQEWDIRSCSTHITSTFLSCRPIDYLARLRNPVENIIVSWTAYMTPNAPGPVTLALNDSSFWMSTQDLVETVSNSSSCVIDIHAKKWH